MKITFTPLNKEHFPLLLKWLESPNVKKWWSGEYTKESIEQKYTPYTEGYKVLGDSKKPMHAFIIEANNTPVGYIQYYNKYDFPPEQGYTVEGLPESLGALDFFIGEKDYLGKSLGKKALRFFLVQHVGKQYENCFVDPDTTNTKAIESYKKAGFKIVKELEDKNITWMLYEKEAANRPLIIFGSSRSDGSTREAVDMVIQNHAVEVVDLNDLKIGYYDYENRCKDDDFMPLARKMLEHNPIILASPVYWYTMSAIMKTFIDRWSDFTSHERDMGRKMRKKTMYVISSYYVDPEGKEGFEPIFEQTAEYMGMHYEGCFFHYGGDNAALSSTNQERANQFTQKIFT